MKTPLRRRASSLVTALLVITILTVIVLAFLQSMSLERKTAVSYSNITRAQMAADAGVADATTMLQEFFTKYPDSATAWVQNMAPATLGKRTPGAALFYYDQVTVTNTNAAMSAQLYFRPLVSGATNVVIQARSNALAGGGGSNNYININAPSPDGEPPWVGLPPGTTSFPIDIPWVEMTASTNTNVVSRYAFWIDDDSFRVNVNTATNLPRVVTSQGEDASELSIQGALSGVFGDPIVRGTLATNIVNLRTNLAFSGTLRGLPDLNYANASYTNLSQQIGFITTVNSSGLNISRTGARRVNLNAIVSTNTMPDDAEEIRKELDRIIVAIQNQAPEFGKRFYRYPVTATNSPPVTVAHQKIYLNKIAANIRDYIDTDSQPTVVMATPNGDVETTRQARTIRPDPVTDDNLVQAIGKENVPRLQESFIHVGQLVDMATQSGQSSSWSIRIAYYFEFWNMGTKDITLADLGPNPFLRVVNQFGWVSAAGGTDPIRDDPLVRDFSIPLSSFGNGSSQPLVFRAGECTVLSTETPISGSFFVSNPSAIYRPRIALTGAPHVYSSSSPLLPAGGGFQGVATLVSKGRGTGVVLPGSPTGAENNWDTGVGVFLGNDNGWIESHHYAVVTMPGFYVDSFNRNNQKRLPNFQWRGGALMGNMGGMNGVSAGGSAQYGDPRSNNEQLRFVDPVNPRSPSFDQTQFDYWYDTGTIQSRAAPNAMGSSMGAPNTRFVNPASFGGAGLNPGKRWDEGANAATQKTLAQGGSPAFYRDGKMRSIGELGHIYDPVRLGANANAVLRSSGGGRTLRIGQSETNLANSGMAMWDGNPTSASRKWVAWRLLDFFSTTDDLQQRGVINPNGALRDGGTAMRAALESFNFSTNVNASDLTMTNKTLSTNALSAFIGSLTNFLASDTNIPFLERGQLSELAFFNTNSLPDLGGVTFSGALNDRGREELFRRLAEMITTKGNTFSVYVMGQALTKLPNGTLKVVASAKRKVTVRLIPQYPFPALQFDPSDPGAVSERFAKATNYAIQILPPSEQ